jgi:hypothetical protein
MKFAFRIKMELVTQAAIILAIVAFSSGSLGTIAIYTINLTISTFCVVALTVVVYFALRFSPCTLMAVPPLAMDPDASEPAPAIPPTFGVPVAAASAIGPMIFQFYPLLLVSCLRGIISIMTTRPIFLVAILRPLLLTLPTMTFHWWSMSVPTLRHSKWPIPGPIIFFSLRFPPGLFQGGEKFLHWPIWPPKLLCSFFHWLLNLHPAHARVH